MIKLFTLILGLSFVFGQALAAEKVCNPTTQATVTLMKESTEDGRFLTARVQHKNSPVKEVTVTFSTPRLFGILSHGEAVTDESGIAQIPFPEDFPGEVKTGDFAVTAKIVKSDVYYGESTVKVDGGKVIKPVDNPFPREIWSPNTDLHLLLTIPFLILGVWSVYVFSIAQLVKLSKMK
ncbi:MAG: hypothetical protein BroJett040_20240 [Oligoflexia bacterium]|nr:MAG: hypothetical protein BroJett040_20240 [Oligoflexia bacterium]